MLTRSLTILGLLTLASASALAADPIVGQVRVIDGDTLCTFGTLRPFAALHKFVSCQG